MKKNERKQEQKVQKDTVKKFEELKKDIDVPRLTSDYLEQTLQIA